MTVVEGYLGAYRRIWAAVLKHRFTHYADHRSAVRIALIDFQPPHVLCAAETATGSEVAPSGILKLPGMMREQPETDAT